MLTIVENIYVIIENPYVFFLVITTKFTDQHLYIHFINKSLLV